MSERRSSKSRNAWWGDAAPALLLVAACTPAPHRDVTAAVAPAASVDQEHSTRASMTHEQPRGEAPEPAAREAPLTVATVSPDLGETPSPLLGVPGPQGTFPLLLVAHGAGGSPEWACAWGSMLLEQPALLACLRGIPMGRDGNSFYYPEHHSLARWLEATRAYVAREYSSRLTGTSVYLAYSQGATMGALALQTAAPTIPHLVLVEGGVDGWTVRRSARFATGGGRSVFFSCGTSSCNEKAERACRALQEAGLEARVAYAPGAGHYPGGEVGRSAKVGLDWSLQLASSEHVQEEPR